MSDVFVAYAREDRVKALHVAEMLRRLGLAVHVEGAWSNGTPWPVYWSNTLRDAGAVVALWTEASRKAPLMLAEAREAHDAGKLVSLTFGADAEDLPPPFDAETAERLSVDLDDDARLEALADRLRTVISGRSDAAPAASASLSQDDAVGVADRLIADAHSDDAAQWSPLFDDLDDAYAQRARTAFASAARSLARAGDAAWRGALAQFAAPDTRLDGLARLEELAEADPDDASWGRVIGALAAPYYPWRALRAYALTNADEAELAALTAPHAFDELKALRLGDARSPAPARVAAAAGAAAGRSDSRTAGALGWVALVALVIAGFAFAPTLLQRLSPSDPDAEAQANAQTLLALSEDAPPSPADDPDADGSVRAAVAPTEDTAEPGAETAAEDDPPAAPAPEAEAASPTGDDAEAATASTDAVETAQSDVSAPSEVVDTTPAAAAVTAPPTEAPAADPVIADTSETDTSEDAADPPQTAEPSADDVVVLAANATNVEAPSPAVSPPAETATDDRPAAEPAPTRSVAIAPDAEPTVAAASAAPPRVTETASADAAAEDDQARQDAIARLASFRLSPEQAASCARPSSASHDVEAGDSLWLIAGLHYGWSCGDVFPVIWRCNAAALSGEGEDAARRSPDAIFPGERIIIPAIVEGTVQMDDCPGLSG